MKLFFKIAFAVMLGMSMRGGLHALIEQVGEKRRIEFIENDSGCKVTRWSPGRQRGCRSFNISSEDFNVTAWLCCPPSNRCSKGIDDASDDKSE